MKKIIALGALIIIILIGVNVFLKPTDESRIETAKNDSLVIENNPEISTTPSPSVKVPVAKSIADRSWDVFQKYIAFAKNHDIDGVKSLAAKWNGTCSKVSDEKTKQDCFKVLDSVSASGSALKKTDFPNILSDAKQIILSSKPQIIDVPSSRQSVKQVLYFTIDTTGNIKLLAWNPSRTFGVHKAGFTETEITEALNKKLKDTDGDAVEDAVETCAVTEDEDACEKTDPNKKDTDGNGNWDSTDEILKN